MNTQLRPGDRCRVEPTPEQLGGLADLAADRPVLMLNLVRFRDVADYSARPDLAPTEPVSGAEAFQRYSAAAQASLEGIGGSVEQFRRCAPTFIGPEDEQWDVMLLVKYPTPAAFRTMISDPAYREAAAHRTAALADSRLIPTGA